MNPIDKLFKTIQKNRPIIINEVIAKGEKEFCGKRGIVIGGGSGIGKAIATALKNRGAEVIICGRKKYSINGMESIIWDVSNIDEINDKFNEIVKKYGKLDFVVNSQGVLNSTKYEAVTKEIFEDTMRTNLESVYFVNQVAMLYYKENRIKGHILNICSTEGLKGVLVPYGISKAGVISLTKGFGRYGIQYGITVNGLAPGATATAMMNMNPNEDLRRNYIPSNRACTPNEIALAAILLLGDAGEQMCGEILVMDGGESLHN